jgi:hypothetical protein
LLLSCFPQTFVLFFLLVSLTTFSRRPLPSSSLSAQGIIEQFKNVGASIFGAVSATMAAVCWYDHRRRQIVSATPFHPSTLAPTNKTQSPPQRFKVCAVAVLYCGKTLHGSRV